MSHFDSIDRFEKWLKTFHRDRLMIKHTTLYASQVLVRIDSAICPPHKVFGTPQDGVLVVNKCLVFDIIAYIPETKMCYAICDMDTMYLVDRTKWCKVLKP